MNLPSVRDPIIWALLVVLAVALAALGITMWQTRGLEADLARSQAHAARLETDRNAVLAQRDEALRHNEAFVAMVQAQGAAIAKLKADAEARQRKASAVARAILTEPAKLPAETGPVALNTWMREQFGSP